MVHHGIARNPRLSRLMKKRYRTEAQRRIDRTLPETISLGSNGEHDVTNGNSQTVLDTLLEKRQDPESSSEDPTKVLATVVSVIDDVPSTLVDATVEASLGVSVSAEAALTISANSADPTSIPTSVPTASPAYSSPTADVPSLTSRSLISTPSSTSTPASSSSRPPPSSSSTSLVAIPSSSASSLNATSQIQDSSSLNSTASWTSTSFTPIVSSTSTFTDSTSTSGGSVVVGGGGGATTGSDPSSTGGSQGPTSSVQQNTGKIVGGVVGGCAGAMFLFLIAFLLIRYRKAAMRKVNNGLPGTDAPGIAGEGSIARSGEMASRRSSNVPLFRASYFAPAFTKRWRNSTQTTQTDSTLVSNSSERGFQKISGRKIPSVLRSGGDGYGGGLEGALETGSPTTSEPSMTLPGSPVLPRSPASQPPPSVPFGMTLDASYTQETDEPDPRVIFRPSPARMPTTESVNMVSPSASVASRPVPQPSGTLSPTIPQRPDLLGRSHPSFDGSRGSRFTESL